MTSPCIKNLDQLGALLKVIPGEVYIFRSNLLSGATIGQHIRHILECYTCLLDSVSNPAHSTISAGLAVSARSTAGSDKHNINEDKENLYKGTDELPVVNYDKRARDPEIETRPGKALETVDIICKQLSSDHPWPGSIYLEGNHELDSNRISRISSSFERELLYNLAHSIHHQALIRVGLLEQNMEHLIDENFGIAPSTIKARNISR